MAQATQVVMALDLKSRPLPILDLGQAISHATSPRSCGRGNFALRRRITLLVHRQKYIDQGLREFLQFCGVELPGH
jgi:hypothetical protein